jgi:N6-L-threonylcarbamoyladenine synthase
MAKKRTIRVLGIETSCDESAVAVVRVVQDFAGSGGYNFDVQSNVIASQVQIHAPYGGVVPEVAAREHVGAIIPTMTAALDRAGVTKDDIDGIAVTSGPGLLSALSVGVETARAVSFALKIPVLGVNHIEGHILSPLLSKDQEEGSELKKNVVFPVLALIVSGGHTELLLVRDWGRYELVGATRDDAAGEAFDKVAKMLGLGYPGGPAVAKTAEQGNRAAYDFPRPMIDSDNFSMSFSGLKTAVRYFVAEHQDSEVRTKEFISDVSASFQQAVVDVLVTKTVRAVNTVGAKSVFLGGGVAANTSLRVQLGAALSRELPDVGFFLPDSSFTGDNAAMIAAAGGIRFLRGEETGWQQLDVDANWELGRA